MIVSEALHWMAAIFLGSFQVTVIGLLAYGCWSTWQGRPVLQRAIFAGISFCCITLFPAVLFAYIFNWKIGLEF